MPEWVTTIGGWAAALVLAIIALLPKKGSLEHQMIDQKQEEIKVKDERLTAVEARIDRLEAVLVWYQRRDVAWELRESRLMMGAERGEYPPWPARDGILTEEAPWAMNR